MSPDDAMRRIDTLLAHVWMVRTFLKHCDEAADDEQLQEIYRELYDYTLAVGAAWKDQDAAAYLKQAHKKYRKLKSAAEFVCRDSAGRFDAYEFPNGGPVADRGGG